MADHPGLGSKPTEVMTITMRHIIGTRYSINKQARDASKRQSADPTSKHLTSTQHQQAEGRKCAVTTSHDNEAHVCSEGTVEELT